MPAFSPDGDAFLRKVADAVARWDQGRVRY
jgi:hypothetical protein